MELLDSKGPAGMGGIIATYPFIGKVVSESAESLMRGGPLPWVDCEYIAAITSSFNECGFCHLSHSAVLENLTECEPGQTTDERRSIYNSIILYVTEGVSLEEPLVERALKDGMTKDEIAHAIAVASLFCFFNNMVSAFGGREASSEEYEAIGKMLSSKGYMIEKEDL